MIAVRPARAEDRDALIAHSLELNRFEHALTGNRRTDRAGAEAGLLAMQEAAAASGGAVLVAEEAGEVVGHLIVEIRRHPPFIDEDNMRHAHISDLYVQPQARRRGVARALVAAAQDFAARGGFTLITVGVLEANREARAVYSALGFDPDYLELARRIAPAGHVNPST